MMKKGTLRIYLCVAALSLLMAAPSFAFDLGGKAMEQRGMGARKKAFLTVYYATLYVPQELKAADAKQVIESDMPTSIIMKIDSRLVSRDTFVSAVREGFEKSAAAGYRTGSVQQYLNFFNDITIQRGDYFYQNYVPGKGMTASYKSVATGQTRTLGTIPGLEFKKAFWGMFLSNNPIDANLKRGMLGR
jgi:hypothetical protein